MPKFTASVIICTYKRPIAVCHLLEALRLQTQPANEILIVDGSPDDSTEKVITPLLSSLPIRYTRVLPEQRGLTRQRNVGVNMAAENDILVFLDDDVIPERDFLKELISTFDDEQVIGTDGLITNECRWQRIPETNKVPANSMVWDGYYLQLSSRERIRKILGLFPTQLQPGIIPPYGHGKSSLPPTGKTYEVEHIMGGITAYRKSVFNQIRFSSYFEGYGLYEDYDFSIRANRFGKLISNTAARIAHYHEPSGRPNTFKYGKMVVTNGWYVWRQRHPHPGLVNIFKWHCITLLLAFFRMANTLTAQSEKRRQAFGDFTGRILAWVKLIFIKPKPLHQ
jgi:GT2 family glycosyltransferase